MASGEIFKAGNIAVITGASSGIGRESARSCSKMGMRVILADIDEKELAEAAEEVAGKAVVCDVSDAAQVAKLADVVFAEAGQVHFAFFNAGIGAGGGAFEAAAKWERTLGVNTWGAIHCSQAFVPKMKASGVPGLVVITGSKQGITMPPGNLAYNVSKAALKTYAEGLEHELRSAEGCKVRAALLVPGWTNTSIMRKSKRDEATAKGEEFDVDKVFFHEGKPAAGAWTCSQVVDFMLEELAKGRFYLICPDNDVTREVDNLRMTWTMQDITEDRPPLSRWHPEYKDKFTEFVAANKK
jgi:NAD(P)-dependent dehydrogenase (short-subunit alcohol dehydrogenase family)